MLEISGSTQNRVGTKKNFTIEYSIAIFTYGLKTVWGEVWEENVLIFQVHFGGASGRTQEASSP